MKQKVALFLIGLFFSLMLSVSPALAYFSGPVNPYSFAAKPGWQAGTVDLIWNDDGTTNNYDLVFGLDPTKLNFGQVNLPFTKSGGNTLTVGSLNPGSTYYFSLVGETNYGTNNSGPITIKAPTGNSVATTVVPAPNPNGVVGVLPANGPGGPIGAYNFMALSGGGNGSIKLTWTDNGSANHYNIAYGFAPGQYLFGATNLSFTPNMNNTYYVGALQKGTRYYFELTSSTDSSYVSRSGPISAVAE